MFFSLAKQFNIYFQKMFSVISINVFPDGNIGHQVTVFGFLPDTEIAIEKIGIYKA